MALKPVRDGAAIVACGTCRHAGEAPPGPDDVRGGARLTAALHEVRAGDPRFADIAVQQMPCLFACRDSCAVHLRAPGKIGYVLGGFEPTRDAAKAILDYAVHYAASEIGQVPYREWPEGVKGHFLARIPPVGHLVE